MHSYIAVIGRFGSGKTEFALNYCAKAASSGSRTALADLDLINPYFTSGLYREELSRLGVDLVASVPSGETVEIPDEVYTLFSDRYDVSVLDVGGDPSGARVLGSMGERLREAGESFRALYVVNCCRPMSSTAEDIIAGLRKIERAASLSVDAIVNNTNLGPETTCEVLRRGDAILREVSDKTGIQVAYHMLTKATSEGLARGAAECLGEPFEIELVNRPGWIDSTRAMLGERRRSSDN